MAKIAVTLVNENLAHARNGEVVLYKRGDSKRWQARFKLKDLKSNSVASNFSKNKREPQTNPLTFRLTSDSAECKIYEITVRVFMHLKSRRDAIQTGALVACLPSLAFSQNNSSDTAARCSLAVASDPNTPLSGTTDKRATINRRCSSWF